MGALYEDVENFFGDIFAFYGRFLARFPIVFILLSLLTSALLGMGLLSVSYETDVEALYTPTDSQAGKDQIRLAAIFPDRTAKAFYQYQQLYLSTYGEIFVQPLEKEEEEEEEVRGRRRERLLEEEVAADNVLSPESVTEILALYDTIMGISLERDDRGFSYSDLCASRQNACVVDGSVLLHTLRREPCFNANDTYPYLRDQNYDIVEDLPSVLAEIHYPDGCLAAGAMRLRFNLRHDTAHQRQLSVMWEIEFIEKMTTMSYKHIRVYYSTSESLDIELSKHTAGDAKFFLLTIAIMIIYSTFVSCGGNWVSTRVLLAQAGIMAALLSILASFGLLSICGLKFVDICGVMPFLVLG